MFILFKTPQTIMVIWFWQRHFFHGANGKGNETHSLLSVARMLVTFHTKVPIEKAYFRHIEKTVTSLHCTAMPGFEILVWHRPEISSLISSTNTSLPSNHTTFIDWGRYVFMGNWCWQNTSFERQKWANHSNLWGQYFQELSLIWQENDLSLTDSIPLFVNPLHLHYWDSINNK